MMIYKATKREFIQDVQNDLIDEKIQAGFRNIGKSNNNKREQDSWWNSLTFMLKILNDPDIPHNAGIAIEFSFFHNNCRIDFIISGKNAEQKKHAIVIELKQWQSASFSHLESHVQTALAGGIRDVAHPSQQASGYAQMLQDYNEAVRLESIEVSACAFLHNFETDEVIKDERFQAIINQAPVFTKRDSEKLRTFIKKFLKYGDDGDILYTLEQGKVKPSPQLSELVGDMIRGNQHFILLNEQFEAYQSCLWIAHKAQHDEKQVLIIEGGPGTGKSVIAIQVLAELLQKGLHAQYISKNSAPRAVYQAQLAQNKGQTIRLQGLFSGSGSYIESEKDAFDLLIVDEAHRLNAKSGLFAHLGENQIQEIIHASRASVFFIDEAQMIHMKDIGKKADIENFAKEAGAQITHLKLNTQFRCENASNFLDFLDAKLQIKAENSLPEDPLHYEFVVHDSPLELEKIIQSRNQENKARMVAGYCWEWKSKKNPLLYDIEFPEFRFKKRWNLAKDGSLWIMKENSIEEVGCIHTCQGLELDHVGVILGEDILVRDGKVLTFPENRAKGDRSIYGYKKLQKENPSGHAKLDAIIKNTYRTLMTRGRKSCHIYSPDAETRAWFKGN